MFSVMIQIKMSDGENDQQCTSGVKNSKGKFGKKIIFICWKWILFSFLLLAAITDTTPFDNLIAFVNITKGYKRDGWLDLAEKTLLNQQYKKVLPI